MLGIDTDNDSAFINQTIVDYCKDHGLTQTRSRPYRKNDQAWVEQKNGAVVRKLTGYDRFVGMDATRALARLYAASRLYINYFQPSFKLKSKTRDGARTVKAYSAPSTPYARLIDCPHVDAAVKARLKQEFEGLDPVALLRDIRAAQQRLREIVDSANTGAARTLETPSDVRHVSYKSRYGLDERRRPTDAPAEGANPRWWRTRRDPLVDVWPVVEQWLLEEPTLTARDLLERLAFESAGCGRR